MKRKKLILINPVNEYIPLISSTLTSKYPPLSLGIIAKLTPPTWDIEIIDENFENFSFRQADLVGITAFTSNITRAYKISNIFRDEGIPVVIGGIHASVLPEEAINYCDTIVIGDAEDTWPDVINDFENNSLQKFYYSKYPDLKNTPQIDHHIFDKRYMFIGIQTSRGCTFRCDFCSVHMFNKGTFRRKPVEQVLAEFESIKNMNKLVFIIDDNIIGCTKTDIEYLKTLFKEIIRKKFNLNWFCQASVNFANDTELVELAAKSGCKVLFVGIEAETVKALTDINKKINFSSSAKHYSAFVKIIHKYGMLVSAGIIFGTDSDTIDSIKKRIHFICKSQIDIFQITPLTPLPGTALFKRLMDEDRIFYKNFPNDWDHYHLLDVVFQPKNLKKTELTEMLNLTYNKIYNKKNIYIRFLKSVFNIRKIKTSLWALRTNFSYRNILYRKSQ
jgi:radical SAM superfamily enzyme YgiQ (UPF0313 family)